jgi:hypothetical protein
VFAPVTVSKKRGDYRRGADFHAADVMVIQQARGDQAQFSAILCAERGGHLRCCLAAELCGAPRQIIAEPLLYHAVGGGADQPGVRTMFIHQQEADQSAEQRTRSQGECQVLRLQASCHASLPAASTMNAVRHLTGASADTEIGQMP